MDSKLGQMGITRWQSPLKTVDDWAVPSPEPTTTLTGYDCYYSSRCQGTTAATASPVPGSASTEVNTVVSAVRSLLLKILVPVFLVALALTVFILYRRRHRYNILNWNARRRRQGGENPRQPNDQDDDQMANLLQVIIALFDQQQQAPPPNNAMVNEIQRANNSIAALRATVDNILVRLNHEQARQGEGQDQPGNDLREALREQLTCPICFEIFYHPVAVINDAAYQGGGCCKASFFLFQTSSLTRTSTYVLWYRSSILSSSCQKMFHFESKLY
jgi:hypothetical protein